jgi:Domain of unknown function (DUF397)
MTRGDATPPSRSTRNSADLPDARWKKSSLSMSNGHCVEVAWLPGGDVGVRHSKDRTGPTLFFTSGEWNAFLGGVYKGEFDASPSPHGADRHRR